MMTKKELEALDTLLLYITNDGWKYKDSEKLTDILFDYVWGLYSTGSEPKDDEDEAQRIDDASWRA
jgi:hypothetical protein